MTVRPARLNAAIAWLFMVGSACFVLGSVPAYVTRSAAGSTASPTSSARSSSPRASACQLVQAQSPATTGVDARTQHVPAPVRLLGWLPHDRNWLAAATQFPGTLFFNLSTLAALAHNATAAEADRYVWRPDLFGSMLFLVASAFGILAVSGRFLAVDVGSLPWRIAWLNMLGSVLSWPPRWPATSCPRPTRWSTPGSRWRAPCSAPSASSSARP